MKRLFLIVLILGILLIAGCGKVVTELSSQVATEQTTTSAKTTNEISLAEKTLDATYCYYEDDKQLCFEKLAKLDSPEKLCFDVPYKTDCIKEMNNSR